MKKGFTLVEILVVIAVVSVVGVIITTIFTRSLRGSNKAQIISQIKQNSQIVLENMDKTIRNADNLVCASNNPDNTLVVEKKGLYTRFRMVIDTQGTTNGSIQQDHPIPTDQESDPKLFIDRVCNPQDPMASAVSLTNTSLQSGVKVITGSFTRNKQAGFKDAVRITFIFSPGVGAPKVVAGQIDPVTFETTVQLR